MRHSNGRIVTIIYSDTDFSDPSTQGPIISFNLLQTDGQLVGYGAVEKLATVHGVHLRTGCFCNTGACMKHLGLSEERVRQNVEVCVCVCVCAVRVGRNEDGWMSVYICVSICNQLFHSITGGPCMW